MAFTLVQTVLGAGSTTVTSRVATITTSAGSCLVAKISSGTQALPTTVVDSAGNTWTKGTAVSDVGGAGNRYASIYYCLNAAAVSSVTITAATSIALELVVEEWTGVGGVRDAASAYNGGQPEALAAGAVAGDAITGCMAWTGGTTPRVTVNPQNGDTYTDQTQFTVSTVYLASAYMIGVSSSGSRGPRWQNPAASFGVSTLVLSPAVPPTFSWSIDVLQG